MRITERRLRLLIREEVRLSENSQWPGSGQKLTRKMMKEAGLDDSQINDLENKLGLKVEEIPDPAYLGFGSTSGRERKQIIFWAAADPKKEAYDPYSTVKATLEKGRYAWDIDARYSVLPLLPLTNAEVEKIKSQEKGSDARRLEDQKAASAQKKAINKPYDYFTNSAAAIDAGEKYDDIADTLRMRVEHDPEKLAKFDAEWTPERRARAIRQNLERDLKEKNKNK
jgi:hypothetical protein